MLNDDEMFYMERELTGYDWRDSAPIEYITESEDYDSDEDDSDDSGLDGWDNDDDGGDEFMTCPEEIGDY
jgi:hypothetical protein